MQGHVHMRGTVIMVTEVGGHNLGQNNYHTITFFFSRKSKFYGHFQRMVHFYGTFHGTFSWYWEQKAIIFGNVLLKKDLHAHLG